MAEPSKHDVEQTMRLIKQDVKPGSKWHPVSSEWLRKVNVYFDLSVATIEDSREFPGPLDNSSIADEEFPVCLKRSVVRSRPAMLRFAQIGACEAKRLRDGFHLDHTPFRRILPTRGRICTPHATEQASVVLFRC
jgi:hypothetical protein